MVLMALPSSQLLGSLLCHQPGSEQFPKGLVGAVVFPKGTDDPDCAQRPPRSCPFPRLVKSSSGSARGPCLVRSLFLSNPAQVLTGT